MQQRVFRTTAAAGVLAVTAALLIGAASAGRAAGGPATGSPRTGPVVASVGPRTPSDPAAQTTTTMMPADSPDAIPVAAGTGGSAAHAIARGVSYLNGVDVSSYQHSSPITWSEVKASGVAFTVIKATESTDYTNSYEPGDVAGARAAGLRVGLYHFADPALVNGSPIADADAEADHFAASINAVTGAQLPPTLDLESTGGLSPVQLVSWTSTFLVRVQQDTGRRPMIYTGPSFWNSNLASTAFASYPLWVAHYTTAAEPEAFGGWSSWTFWQWTDGSYFSPGGVPGISGAVDRDRFNGSSLGALEAVEAASNGVTAPYTGTASATRDPDGLLVRVTGTASVYVIAGGAPVYVDTFAHYPGAHQVRVITAAEFYSLRSQPRDGVFVRDVDTGSVYTIAGQAPIAVTSWGPWGGRVQPYVNVASAAISDAGLAGEWSHLRMRPLDGTFLLSGETGGVFRTAGGAPIYVSSWSYFGGIQPTVRVTDATITAGASSATATGRFSHLLFRPMDGTLLADPIRAAVWVVKGGAISSTTSGVGATVVGESAITEAGQPGVWQHLLS